MHTDIMGDDLLGDDIGDLLEGDFLQGGADDVGDYLVGGDDIMGDYLVGADDILGDDFLVGAAGAGAPRRQQSRHGRGLPAAAIRSAAVRNAIMRKRLQNATLVQRRPPTKTRVLPLGFSRDGVPAGETVEIIARPQVMFRGRRLLVGSTIAPLFKIEDIKVGRTSQLAGGGANGAEAFRDTATGDNLSLDTCMPGVDIALLVKNKSAAAADFSATMFGNIVE